MTMLATTAPVPSPLPIAVASAPTSFNLAPVICAAALTALPPSATKVWTVSRTSVRNTTDERRPVVVSLCVCFTWSSSRCRCHVMVAIVPGWGAKPHIEQNKYTDEQGSTQPKTQGCAAPDAPRLCLRSSLTPSLRMRMARTCFAVGACCTTLNVWPSAPGVGAVRFFVEPKRRMGGLGERRGRDLRDAARDSARFGATNLAEMLRSTGRNGRSRRFWKSSVSDTPNRRRKHSFKVGSCNAAALNSASDTVPEPSASSLWSRRVASKLAELAANCPAFTNDTTCRAQHADHCQKPQEVSTRAEIAAWLVLIRQHEPLPY